MAIRDRAFQRVFSKTFVYNILFEDAEVDERFLGLDEDSTVLSITGAGCGVAGMVSRHARSVDAVDINGHHLALAALKATAAKHLDDYGTFYDLLGRGWHPDAARVLQQLSDDLPPWVARYWRRHHRRFSRSLYHRGLTARMLGQVRKQIEIDASWAREMGEKSPADREVAVREILAPLQRNPAVRAVLRSPVQLLALGINFEQRDRLVDTERMNMVDYFVEHLVRVMDTDLATNWFFWFAAAGQFNHDRDDAVPPYLRRDRWERSVESPTDLRFHHGNLFHVLGGAGPDTWSHYTLCDAVDWMPPTVQRKLFEEIRRTARPGATVLWRSVSEEDLPGELGVDWLARKDCTDEASRLDRSRQYRQVNFYEVQA